MPNASIWSAQRPGPSVNPLSCSIKRLPCETCIKTNRYSPPTHTLRNTCIKQPESRVTAALLLCSGTLYMAGVFFCQVKAQMKSESDTTSRLDEEVRFLFS